MHSFSLCEAARGLLLWAYSNITQILTCFIQDKLNVLADKLSRCKQVTETTGVHQPVETVEVSFSFCQPLLTRCEDNIQGLQYTLGLFSVAGMELGNEG